MTAGQCRPCRTFARSARLRKRADFLRVQASGVRVEARSFVLLLARRPDLPVSFSPGDTCRLGIVASRKLGGAVKRNRAKRLVREAFRRLADLFPPQLDIVIVARPVLPALSRGDVEADLRRAAPAVRRRAAGPAAGSCSA